MALATIALPYLPINTILGLTPLSPDLVLGLLGITLLYLLGTEATKRFFFRRVSQRTAVSNRGY